MADGSVFLSRYADVVAVYKDTRDLQLRQAARSSGPKYGASPLLEHHTTSLVFNDPPLHTRVRRLIAGALTPRHIAAMERRLVERVDSLLDAMARAGRRGRPDHRLRQRDPGRDHRQPARRAGRGARAAARLVAGDPRRARADAHARSSSSAATARCASSCSTSRAWSSAAAPSPAIPRVDVLTRLIAGEGGEPLSARRAAAQLHLPAQRRPRDDDQPDRQRPRLPARLARREGAPARRARRWSRTRGRGVSSASRARTSSATGSRPARPRSPASRSRRGTQVTIGIGAANRDPEHVRRSRPARHRAHAEPPRRLRLGHPSVRRHGPGAARRPRRDRPLPRALPELPARRAGGAGPAGALSRPCAPAGGRRPAAIDNDNDPPGDHRHEPSPSSRPLLSPAPSSPALPLRRARADQDRRDAVDDRPGRLARHPGEEHDRAAAEDGRRQVDRVHRSRRRQRLERGGRQHAGSSSARTRSTRSSARRRRRTRWR